MIQLALKEAGFWNVRFWHEADIRTKSPSSAYSAFFRDKSLTP